MLQLRTVVMSMLGFVLAFDGVAAAQVLPEEPQGLIKLQNIGPKRVFNPRIEGDTENKEAPQMVPAAQTPPPQPGPMVPGPSFGPGGAGALQAVAPSAPGGTPLAPAVPPAPGAEAEKDAIKVTGTQDDIARNPTGVTDIPCQPLDLNEEVNLDFKEVPIDDLIRLMSCWTGKNFMLTAGFAGKNVTLMSPKAVTVAQAYRAFLSALRTHGLILVPAGAYLKIVPDTTGRQEGTPILDKESALPGGDEMVTKIIPLLHVPASEITQVLDKFKGKAGEIIAYGEDTLIITDHAIMIERLLELLKELDLPTEKEKIWVRQVEYAQAGELTNVITGLFTDANGGAAKKRPVGIPQPQVMKGRPMVPGQRPGSEAQVVGGEGEEIAVSKILSDERTNQLILVCNRATYLRVDKLLRKLDVPIPGEGQIHIIYLENADSEEIASTLSSLTSGSAAGGAKGVRKVGGATAAVASTGGSSAALFEGEVKITADKGTNALVVEASLKDFMSLRKVVDLLDIRRKQVYVEAVIMEISSNKNRNFSMSSSAGTTFNANGEEVPLLVGMGGLGISGFDGNQLSKGGMAVGLQGPLVDVSTGDSGTGSSSGGSMSIPTFGFMLQAIASNSDVNILSTPHILTTDNEEAEIQVGKQIPYQASSAMGLGSLAGLGGMGGMGGYSGMDSTYGGAYGSNYGSSMGSLGMLSALSGMGGMVQRIDVDLTLKITPHANESNFVKLEIEQSIEDVESIDRALGPTTSKRKVKNVVVVKDQQPVVIGGLMRDTESEGVDKVPLLGDIPLIGALFRKNVTTVEKKNLLMVIVPHIIEDPSDLNRIHRERTEEIRRFAEYIATKQKDQASVVDWRKKSGGLESMNEVLKRARQQREERERARFEGSSVDIIGPAETHDLDYDPEAVKKQEQQ